MLDLNDPLTEFQLRFMKDALPANDAIVFGDMYLVDGGYTKALQDMGPKVTLLDVYETAEFQKLRIENPDIEYFKGDFSDPDFMKSIHKQYDMGVVHQILLHQAPLLHTIHLMLEKVKHRFSICHPIIEELELPNGLIYLPGNTAFDELYPFDSRIASVRGFKEDEVYHQVWIWAMTRSFLISVMRGEGFELVNEDRMERYPNKRWFIWGGIFERRHETPFHWDKAEYPHGLFRGSWD